MPRKKTNAKGGGGAASVFVDHVAQAVKAGSSIGGKATRAMLAELRAGVQYAAPIAFGAEKFDIGDAVLERAADAMNDAGERIQHIGVMEGVNPEPYYLLGMLVGIEIAGGLKGGAR